MFTTTVHKFMAIAWACLATCAVSASQTPTSPSAITLPADSPVFAKLTSTLDLGQLKVGDQLTAQATNDVKVGNQAVIKKGATLIGHVMAVEPPKGSQTDTKIGIVMDSVSSKNSSTSIVLLIRAIAPPVPEDQPRTISEGRGMPGATDAAVVPGHASSGGTVGGRLTASSAGVMGFPNIHLGSSKASSGPPMTVISLSPGDAKLKSGTQLLLKVPSP
jgi:hypothetical protein